MKFISPFRILFVILVLQETIIPLRADEKFIQDTCKHTEYYDLCMSILLANPKSRTADLSELALIGVDEVKNKGITIIQKIEDFRKSQPELKMDLDYCYDAYNTTVKVDVPLAVQALSLGRVMFAEDGIADAAVEADACEDTFSQNGHTSPMTDLNTDMNHVANTIRQIIRQLY
ncbi:cell wall / vacuolar inhibitor of fructosidase 1-like [Rutidosis leptorrhynchoides]|uniref:cell wall / vacuolar inhibitor of fructosidase 1-like n=1 Tax=Rutidosis leptorrhynchoides TaxID=125765 RepID=UPI003A98FEC1